MKRLISFLILVMTVAWGSAAAANAATARAAKPGPLAGQQGRRAAQANAEVITPQELERLFDSYVLLQAQDTLKLSDAQFPPFLTRLKALQETRRRNLQARRQLLAALNALLKESPFDEAQARVKLKALRDLEVRAADDARAAYDALVEVLDTMQQARFRVFEEAVERRKIDLLLRARRAAADAARANPGK